MQANEMIVVEGLAKSFRLHLMGGVELPVVDGVVLSVRAGECVVLGRAIGGWQVVHPQDDLRQLPHRCRANNRASR